MIVSWDRNSDSLLIFFYFSFFFLSLTILSALIKCVMGTSGIIKA